MDAALILEDTVDALAGNAEHHLLIPSGCAFAGRGDGGVPALALAEFEIHFAEVAGKNRGFVAAGTAADFEDGVLAVLGVGGDEKELDFLLQARELRRGLVELQARHLAHFGVRFVGQQLAGLLGVGEQTAVARGGGGEALELLVLLGQAHVSAHVGYHRRVGNQGPDFLEAGVDALEAFEQGVLAHFSSSFGSGMTGT